MNPAALERQLRSESQGGGNGASLRQSAVEPEAVAEPCHITDLGNGQRFARQQGKNLRFCSQLGWLVWDKKRWALDEGGEVEALAKETVRAIYIEAANCSDKDRRDAVVSWAHKSESQGRIDAMIDLAKSEPGIPVRQRELDRDPWLLNVANGTLDLKTGELREHRREDLITKLIDVEYHLPALCPTWEAFLDRVMDHNAELSNFIQKAVGYSLTASIREQCLLILFGLGANGKSTFLNVLGSLFGDYGRTTRTETLLVKRGDMIPNDVARLAGARFVSAVETESGRRLAEGLVKQMTGGDRMAARFLHREFFEFEPTFKLWLAVNHKPRIVGTDNAIWRRIRLIPFTVTIPEADRDPDLADKLKAELPGILRWAVDGCALWQDHGLKAPETVTTATKDYREESDAIVAFLDECCKQEPDLSVSKGGLYEAYGEWAKKSGELPVTKKELGLRLIEKGFSEDRTKNGRFWLGVGLSGDTYRAGDT